MFLTPNRPTHNKNISLDNLSFQAFSEGKNVNESEKEESLSNMEMNIDISNLRENYLKRSLTSS